ncbi:MAG: A/G-specific adenine glycosylase [Gallionellaceae bacterium]
MPKTTVVPADFSSRLISWQLVHGRHGLPWQGADAYQIWLSEIMLQQTQVTTVIPYFLHFIEVFPNIAKLAAATQEEVLANWSGLGYYARGRNLHRAAQIMVEKFHGEFPRNVEQILALPGVGRSTAAAICALAFQERRAILDGNVKRVLARYCGIAGWAGNKKIEEQLWQQAEALLPAREVATYTQALMDMGASVCTRSRPKCALCPVQNDCVALLTECTAKLPTPRPRKIVPEKHASFLLLLHGNEILLEKRPGSGIWGGLWCLPQFDNEQEAIRWLQSDGYRPDQSILPALPPFTHIFTHFKLHIMPLLFRLTHKPPQIQQSNSAWFGVEEALQAGIPTPVRKLLKQLSNTA